jgi:hypothetical protein
LGLRGGESNQPLETPASVPAGTIENIWTVELATDVDAEHADRHFAVLHDHRHRGRDHVVA